MITKNTKLPLYCSCLPKAAGIIHSLNYNLTKRIYNWGWKVKGYGDTPNLPQLLSAEILDVSLATWFTEVHTHPIKNNWLSAGNKKKEKKKETKDSRKGGGTPLKSILFWSKFLMNLKLKKIFYHNQNSSCVFFSIKANHWGHFIPKCPQCLAIMNMCCRRYLKSSAVDTAHVLQRTCFFTDRKGASFLVTVEFSPVRIWGLQAHVQLGSRDWQELFWLQMFMGNILGNTV